MTTPAQHVDLDVEPAAELVTLRDRVVLPLDAILLALDLEQRGIRLSLDTDGVLLAGPKDLVRPGDVEAIREHREALRRIVIYSAEQLVS